MVGHKNKSSDACKSKQCHLQFQCLGLAFLTLFELMTTNLSTGKGKTRITSVWVAEENTTPLVTIIDSTESSNF